MNFFEFLVNHADDMLELGIEHAVLVGVAVLLATLSTVSTVMDMELSPTTTTASGKIVRPTCHDRHNQAASKPRSPPEPPHEKSSLRYVGQITFL
ncbi:hypothetical protein [Arthrobacter sp. TMS1-12-1]